MKLNTFNDMEMEYVKIPLIKIIELVVMEERHKIRKHYLDSLGKPTADVMDSYIIEDCEILKILKEKM